MQTLETHIVPPLETSIRLSDYAVGIFRSVSSRKGIKKALKKGAIWVDDQCADSAHWVQSGQQIELREIDRTIQRVYELPLTVIYEDDHLAIIHKIAGIPVSGNRFKTIENALPHNLTPSTSKDYLQAFRPVHRLDAATSGLLIVAKTLQSRMKLGEQFEQQHIKKHYQAIVIGKMEEKGVINMPIGEKVAITHFERADVVSSLRNQYLSLLHLYPKTGRTHQLRIHLSEAGFPIFGDSLYGTTGETFKGKGLMLAAVGLAFVHPISGEPLQFRLETPHKFTSLLKREQRRWEKYFGHLYKCE